MNIELIHAIVRQTTVLIAQLATSGGWRAPLAQVANQVFLDLVTELERQGVSRKVSADMFGMGLRTYQRTIRRITESSTEHGRSLWEAVLAHIREHGITTRTEVAKAFDGDDDGLLRSVLHDLCDSHLVFQSGQGTQAVYRAATDDELRALHALSFGEGFEELLWAIVYREGPLTCDELIQRIRVDRSVLEQALERLVGSARIERTEEAMEAKYSAASLYVPLGSPVGWEAAIFDHYQAMVKTILCRLREERVAPSLADRIGGSTYTVDVWPGHPFEERAYDALSRLRASMIELRQQIEAFNDEHERPEEYTQVLLYLGQCLIPQEPGGNGEAG